MTCALACLSSISTVIVAIQFFAKVVPWLYENIIGPMILGPKLKLRDYGDWACKYTEFYHLDTRQVLRPLVITYAYRVHTQNHSTESYKLIYFALHKIEIENREIEYNFQSEMNQYSH